MGEEKIIKKVKRLIWAVFCLPMVAIWFFVVILDALVIVPVRWIWTGKGPDVSSLLWLDKISEWWLK